MKIQSTLCSLADITRKDPHWHFNVPIYQRLYVWGDDQVRTLLEDLINAYERDDDVFFLGGTLMVEQDAAVGQCFDLIDGQQRFTTLWLLCRAWQGELTRFLNVNEPNSNRPRLQFAIRPEVNRFLERLASGVTLCDLPDEDTTRPMRVALDLMHSVFEKRSLPNGVTCLREHIQGLASFVFEKVKFVVTAVPRETDLNKLFEVINNRGIQLQHHEILKARLLDALPESERGAYALLWDACSDMDIYAERNLAGLMGKGAASEVCTYYERGELTSADAVRKLLQNRNGDQQSAEPLTLAAILADTGTEAIAADDNVDPGDVNETGVRSIFGFPLFLQHVLRIWLFENNRPDLPRLLDRKLLSLFEAHFFNPADNLAGDPARFIDLLWRLRVLFDQHVIKWVDQGEEEVHLISAVSVSPSNGKRYMNRSLETDAHRGFSLLQSMLYHSQEITTQYWLTPLLLFIHRNPESNADSYFRYLRHLDNHLLGSSVNKSLVERTWSFMETPWQQRQLVHREELSKPKGVKFAHYWFYKLEFVLWFQKKHKNGRWQNFRLTAKSSVEHISPQTPTERDENRVEKLLDHFGNLALVSRSLNSEFGNKPFNEKRPQFTNKNMHRVDSLKMELIYENEYWNDEVALAHQNEMIRCLDDYCQDTDIAAIELLGKKEREVAVL